MSEPCGTYACPHCGLDRPHHHPAEHLAAVAAASLLWPQSWEQEHNRNRWIVFERHLHVVTSGKDGEDAALTRIEELWKHGSDVAARRQALKNLLRNAAESRPNE